MLKGQHVLYQWEPQTTGFFEPIVNFYQIFNVYKNTILNNFNTEYSDFL